LPDTTMVAASAKHTTYWTEADKAELAVLLNEWTDGVYAHRQHCTVCTTREWCNNIREALYIILDWQYHRALLTHAEALRERMG
jgi:hypothetical protein